MRISKIFIILLIIVSIILINGQDDDVNVDIKDENIKTVVEECEKCEICTDCSIGEKSLKTKLGVHMNSIQDVITKGIVSTTGNIVDKLDSFEKGISTHLYEKVANLYVTIEDIKTKLDNVDEAKTAERETMSKLDQRINRIKINNDKVVSLLNELKAFNVQIENKLEENTIESSNDNNNDNDLKSIVNELNKLNEQISNINIESHSIFESLEPVKKILVDNAKELSTHSKKLWKIVVARLKVLRSRGGKMVQTLIDNQFDVSKVTFLFDQVDIAIIVGFIIFDIILSIQIVKKICCCGKRNRNKDDVSEDEEEVVEEPEKKQEKPKKKKKKGKKKKD